MDDFNLSTIIPSRAEWCEQFIMIVKPCILEGFDEIFKGAEKLSIERKMPNEYLTTFQKLILQIPKWNQTIIDIEKKRIEERSRCSYLEILLTATYIAQLKILSAIRAGTKSKKVDIDIPPLAEFIHKIYMNVGSEIYKNVYLYVKSSDKYYISSLDVQKNRNKLDHFIREGILKTFRTTIPVDKILKVYLEPTEEEDITVKTEEQIIYNNMPVDAAMATTAAAAAATTTDIATTSAAVDADAVAVVEPIQSLDSESESMHLIADDALPEVLLPSTNDSHLSFNDIDTVHNGADATTIEAPKTIERLEEISQMRNAQRKAEDAAAATEEDDDGREKIHIGDEILDLPDLYDEEIA